MRGDIGRGAVEAEVPAGIRIRKEQVAHRPHRRIHQLPIDPHRIEHIDAPAEIDSRRRFGTLEVPHRVVRDDGVVALDVFTDHRVLAGVAQQRHTAEQLDIRLDVGAEHIRPQVHRDHLVAVGVVDEVEAIHALRQIGGLRHDVTPFVGNAAAHGSQRTSAVRHNADDVSAER